MTPTDQQFMELALRMGRRNLGATAENPSVGCVIVKGGIIVGRGVTAPSGRPHAETQALDQAGQAASGATVFVTLEPCAHHGNTPPCCDALIAAGVAKVLIAVGDPDPRTAGQGASRMREAGVFVSQGLCEADGRANLAGYLSRVERRRPWVTLKLAVSADGMIAGAVGEQTVITGPQALRVSQMMRAQTDGIMVGAGTVRTDDPSLTCRLPGLEARSPVRIVVGGGSDLLIGTNLYHTARDVPVWHLGAGEVEGDVKSINCDIDGQGNVDLNSALDELAKRGIGRLLVEGGAKLAQSLLQAELVDEAVLFSAPHALGVGGVEAPLGLIQSSEFTPKAPILLGVDEMTVYDRVR